MYVDDTWLRQASRQRLHSSSAPIFWKQRAILCIVHWIRNLSQVFRWNMSRSSRVCAFWRRLRALSYWSFDMKWMAESFSSWRIRGTSSSSRSSSFEYSFWKLSSQLFNVVDELWFCDWRWSFPSMASAYASTWEAGGWPAMAPVAGELPLWPFGVAEAPECSGARGAPNNSESWESNADLVFL